jgi:hypothetical protein
MIFQSFILLVVGRWSLVVGLQFGHKGTAFSAHMQIKKAKKISARVCADTFIMVPCVAFRRRSLTLFVALQLNALGYFFALLRYFFAPLGYFLPLLCYFFGRV